MYFVQFSFHASPLFYNSNILKFIDIIYSENFVIINKCFNNDTFAVLLKNLIYALIAILAISDPPVKVSFLFQHTFDKIRKKINDSFLDHFLE